MILHGQHTYYMLALSFPDYGVAPWSVIHGPDDLLCDRIRDYALDVLSDDPDCGATAVLLAHERGVTRIVAEWPTNQEYQ